MRDPGREKLEELLLEWHLGLLDAEERARLSAELHRDKSLRAKSENLGRILRPLDHWTVSSGAENLAERVLLAVERFESTPGRDTAPVLEPVESGVFRFPFFRLRDVAGIAACILLLLSVAIPGVSELRSRSQRTQCAGNLGDIFRGLAGYQTAFAGSLPFAGYNQNAAWLPDRNDQATHASNSRHVFLLLKKGFVSRPQAFVCPCADDAVPMKTAKLNACDDFDSARNIRYDSLNLSGMSPNVRPMNAIAYLGDANPLFVGARFNESLDPEVANSPAHGGRGQTVLILDGHTEFLRTPFYGSRRDNVWVIEGVRRYTGNEVPVRCDDAFLVPGFPHGDDPPLNRPTYQHIPSP